MQVCRVCIICLFLFDISFALEPAKANLEPLPHLRGDEQISITVSVPYLGNRQSPGDQIGTTWYDLQADCSYGQRIMVDGHGQPHIDWMKRDAAGANRYCAWNARFSNGSWYGETQASPSWSGYAKIDITRNPNPDSQRSVITYHYNPGAGYYSYIDIDGGNLWGAWPNNPRSPQIDGYIWPTICVADNNNIILATGDYGSFNLHHIILTTDEGETWSQMLDLDSCSTLSRFLRASHNPGSNKAVFIHTRYITDSVAAGQLDNDIWYSLSDDGGINWGPHTNITDYQPSDTVRAYCDVNAIFDNNDNLHIVWGGRKVTDNYYSASKIFHWDEINDTITIINSPSIYYNEPGGWWITVAGVGYPGAWRMPADEPQLVVDTANGYVYCLWHGNDDYTDTSAAGWPNGELYGSYSTDNGITWSDYVNLTNTRTPGAGPGACHDEDYMTAHPYVFNDSIWTTYIEDKDAGAYPHTEGVETENPVRCWVFWTGLIRTGVEEDQGSSAKFQEPMLNISPNPFTTQCVVKIQAPELKNQMDLNIYDASGRVVYSFSRITQYALRHTLFWSGTDQAGRPVPAGVYFVELNTGDEIITEKIIRLK